ncbi:MAG: AMP-binding protein [Spirochaetes bacterium]|nr:AMP-binding protein [Spirochaetota bacterium]
MNNLYDFFTETCLKYKDEILFDNVITYHDAYELSLKRAAFLRKEGFKKGDVIGILAENSAEWCITYMALTICGIIALPIDPNLTPDSYNSMIRSSGMKAVFISEIYRNHIKKARKYVIDFDKNIIKNISTFKPAAVKEDHIAALIFTSGTTGKPKIVPLTHKNVFKTSIAISDFLDINKTDNFLNILPLFHAYAFVANFTGPFARGASFYFLRSLKGPDIVKTLAENEFTIFPAAPQLWELFMDSIINKAKAQSAVKYRILMFFLKTAPFFKAVGLGILPALVFKPVRKVFGMKIKYLVSGGAPLKKKYFNYYRNMGIKILEGYGLSETTGPVSITHWSDSVAGCVGPPTQGNYVQIRNVNADGIGEIWLKGDSVMPGYYKNPSANSEVFDDDKWFNTGDLGRVDKRNYIYVTGRNKNVIVLDSGKNVYPEELEAYYKQSPLISEICIFGRKAADREIIHAVIVPFRKTKESYAEIRQEIIRLNKGLPSYKIIFGFSLSFDPLPVNSTRKVLVHEVRRLYEKGVFQNDSDDNYSNRNELIPQTAQEEEIYRLLLKRFKKSVLFSNDTFQDYGVDSLGLIDLVSFIEEKMGVSINISDVKKLDTLEEFVRYAAACRPGEGLSIEDRILRGNEIKRYVTHQSFLTEMVLFFIKRIALKYWNLTFEGIENINEENFILAVNHQSNLDYPLLNSIIPVKFRRSMFVIGKKELSFLRFILPGSNAVFVDRSGDVVPSLKAGADILRQKKSLCIFPEGTRSIDGEIGSFKSGVSYLSKNLNVKIIPVIIDGTIRILPRDSFFPDLSGKNSVRIAVLPAVDPGKFKTPDMLSRSLEKVMKDKLSEMRSK